MEGALARVVSSCLEFLHVNLKAGMDPKSEQFAKFNLDATKTISARLCCIGKIPMRESASLISLVDQGPMTQEGKAALIEVINSKVDMSCDEVVATKSLEKRATGAKGQIHLHFENYLTASDWEQLCGDRSFSTKLAVLSKRAIAIGLRNPSEPTYASMFAVVLLASGQEAGPEVLQGVQELKKIHRSIVRHSGVGSSRDEFPVDVNEFAASHKDWHTSAYCGEGPSASRLDPFQLNMTRAMTPCRSTWGGAASQPSCVAKSDPMTRQLLPMLKKAITLSSQPIPGLQIFKRPEKAASPLAMILETPALQAALTQAHLQPALTQAPLQSARTQEALVSSGTAAWSRAVSESTISPTKSDSQDTEGGSSAPVVSSLAVVPVAPSPSVVGQGPSVAGQSAPSQVDDMVLRMQSQLQKNKEVKESKDEAGSAEVQQKADCDQLAAPALSLASATVAKQKRGRSARSSAAAPAAKKGKPIPIALEPSAVVTAKEPLAYPGLGEWKPIRMHSGVSVYHHTKTNMFRAVIKKGVERAVRYGKKFSPEQAWSELMDKVAHVQCS